MNIQRIKGHFFDIEFISTSKKMYPYERPLKKLLKKSISSFELWMCNNSNLNKKNYGKKIECGVVLCGKTHMKTLNSKFRGINNVTDVLSFPLYDNLRKTVKNNMDIVPVLNMGDVIICREVAKLQAKKFELTVEYEIIHLLVHGFLHLWGMDHEISLKEQRKMEKEEKIIISNILLNE